MDIQTIKNRFEIIGNSGGLNRALNIAMQVAPTDLSVLISGESGVGKERIPQIIHSQSKRKHNNYIAVNCGAIPEGTIDSELFGHIKGSFTSAHADRKGYFEEADSGTIFLDEVSELPLGTQVRLLRVLESGEFIKVGSSKVQKTNVRVVAATNVNLLENIKKGKFREDLYYRLNTVPIIMPALRERKEDIILLFKKFSGDFAEKYRMPRIQLSPEAEEIMKNYRWPGNIRQLKNITEQISIIEENRNISAPVLKKYLTDLDATNLPVLYSNQSKNDLMSEREILYQVLFDMKKDVFELKKLVNQIIKQNPQVNFGEISTRIIQPETPLNYSEESFITEKPNTGFIENTGEFEDSNEIIEENFSLAEKEKEMIINALERNNSKRKPAAKELGISERTLYRKIKEYNIKN
jgi:DNA-binding NtrC family response regulator